MNRNQKIALGCGGAGCLGLIVVVIAAGLIYFLVSRPAKPRFDSENIRVVRNSNSNDNSDFTSNTNDNTSNSNSSRSTSSSDSTLSEDDKHKLYHAAGMTGDAELIRRVNVKIGLTDEDFTPGENFDRFVQEHASWSLRNTDFILSINTAEKGRAYLQTHLQD